MTRYITWPIDQHEILSAQYYTVTGETLSPAFETDTHFMAGSTRVTSGQEAQLADTALVFNDEEPKGWSND